MELIAPAIFFSTLGLMLLMRGVLSRLSNSEPIIEYEDNDDFDLAMELETELNLHPPPIDAYEMADKVGEPAAAAISSETSNNENSEVELDIEDAFVLDLEPHADQITLAKADKAELILGHLRKSKKRKRSARVSRSEKRWRVQVIISSVVLAAALTLIFTRQGDAEAQKWAFGTVGLILGFWLKA